MCCAAYRDVLDDDVVRTVRHPETFAEDNTTGTFADDLDIPISICSDSEHRRQLSLTHSLVRSNLNPEKKIYVRIQTLLSCTIRCAYGFRPALS